MIEVFTHGSPSPRKVTIMLEELGVPFENIALSGIGLLSC